MQIANESKGQKCQIFWQVLFGQSASPINVRRRVLTGLITVHSGGQIRGI